MTRNNTNDKQNSGTERETAIEEAINELEPKVKEPAPVIRSELENLLSYKMKIEEAKGALLNGHLTRTYSEKTNYNRFDSWGGELPPPKVDPGDWVVLDPTDGSATISKIGSDLSYYNHVPVYCLYCAFTDRSVRSLERRAKEYFGEIPSWLSKAYTSDHAFYIGQSAQLGRRLKAHTTGVMSDHTPPSRMARLSEIEAVGIVFQASSRDEAEELEKLYADNFNEVTSDEVFVYHA